MEPSTSTPIEIMSVAEGPGMSTAQRKNPRALLRHFHWHWVKGGASPAIREVLTALWCHAEANDEATVSLSMLAEELEVTRSTVRYQLRLAEGLKLVNTTQRGNRATRRLLLNPVDNCLYCATGPRTTPPKCAGKCAGESTQVREPDPRTITGINGGNGSLPSETGEPQGSKQYAEELNRIVTERELKHAGSIDHPEAWRATVRRQIEAEHGPRIRELLDRFDPPPGMIAGYVQGNPAPYLDFYRRTTP